MDHIVHSLQSAQRLEPTRPREIQLPPIDNIVPALPDLNTDHSLSLLQRVGEIS